MKGIVFTEFLEMVESRFGLGMVDALLETVRPPSGGAYTAVGTYPCMELVSLVRALAQATHTSASDLVRAFGQHLFGRFYQGYPALFTRDASAFDFLRGVERHIHAEVRKLYPDAELPHFSYEEPAPHQLVMLYESRRPLADLAEGLIRACIDHFGEPIRLAREDIESSTVNRTRFTLTMARGHG